jgi:PAS domain S-box-containing protein
MSHSIPEIATGKMALRHLLEKLPVATYACDVEGSITYFNARATEVWGRAPKLNDAEERYCGSFRLYSTDGTPIRRDQCWMALAIKNNEEYNEREVVIEREDGSRLTVLLNASPIQDDTGKLLGAVIVMMDITARKQAEQAMRECERRFRETIDALPAAVYTTDADGRLISFNPAAVEFSGREPELGTDRWCVSWKLYYSDGAPMPHDECPMAIALKEGRAVHGTEAIAERPDGKRIWFEPYPTPIRDSEGKVVGGANMLLDITERKQVEAALRESEGRLRHLLDMLPVAAYSCNTEGLITYFNQRAVEVWGREPALNNPIERFCGSFKLYSPAGTLIPHNQCWMALALDEEKAFEGREIVIERPDGSRLTVLANVNPLYNAEGKLIGAINIVVDITDRKQAEALMSQMAAIVESSDDAIISKDLNGIVVSWNKGAEKLFGYTAAEVIGKSVTALFPPDRVVEEAQILERLRLGEQIDHYETARRHKDGYDVDVSLTISPIPDKTGKIIGASKIARDISERKRIEVEREEMLLKESAARAEAEAANRSKDEFLALVSHELRSPLSAIIGYNRILRERLQDDAQVTHACDIIERNARTQLQLIEDLLDTARIASGKLKLDLRKLDIAPVLADALDIARMEAETNGVQLRIADCGLRIADSQSSNNQIESGNQDQAPPRENQSAIIREQGPRSAIVLGDAARLQQIVWNLLSNAIKFTPTGGVVELRAELGEDHICVIVSDTGKGIQPEFIPYVFDRFRQRDSSSSQRSGGLGLGLALVKHLAELHGGKVEATSEGEGRGATFTFTMPLAAQDKAPAAEPPTLAALAASAASAASSALTAAAAPAALVNGKARNSGDILLPAGFTIEGLRVLVVDDHEEARATLSDFLNGCGAVVMTAASGEEAMTFLLNPPDGAPPDVLLCDIAMPEEDGYAALRRVRALEASRGVAPLNRIPAIALTALTGAKERLRALSAGFNLHVAKPVDPVELMLVIANMAGIR